MLKILYSTSSFCFTIMHFEIFNKANKFYDIFLLRCEAECDPASHLTLIWASSKR